MTENKVLSVSCEHSTRVTSADSESKGNANDANLTEDESSLDVLNFFTNHVMIEQILVEPSFYLPLSQDDLLDVPCDKDDLNDDIYIIPIMNDHAICMLESNTTNKNRHVFIMLAMLMS
jgi:hypothetical protein